MRRKARKDENHAEIVRALRLVGASVWDTCALGRGVDLVVGYKERNFLFEVKDGSKLLSRQRLTPQESEFISSWAGVCHVVNSVEQAYRILGIGV
jgi:hypothetical protein